MQYRRNREAGGTYFFTLVTYQRQHLLTIPENIIRLRTAFKREMHKRSFEIEAIVILPDHLHTLWILPETDDDYSTRWSNIKRYFSTACVGVTGDVLKSRQSKRNKPVWQNRFWEHTIQNERDRQNHMDYIHYNPVKHGLVKSPGEWPYSSFRRSVKKGWYEESWGKGEPENIKGMDFE